MSLLYARNSSNHFVIHKTCVELHVVDITLPCSTYGERETKQNQVTFLKSVNMTAEFTVFTINLYLQ